MSYPDLYRLNPRGPREGSYGLSQGDRDAGGGFPLGRRVLITEDNWLVAGEWQAALEDAGYEVVGLAASAEEALEICERETPDLILMDIRLLGDRDGVEAAKDARTRFDIPSVFVSAHDDSDVRRRAAEARPLGWITKPVVASRIPELLIQFARPLN
ncbi:MAG: response regulator [Phenylobacterium sp.]|uniref:response regulator n=1 Tax=Phenylobacterium sp. TaxID=1871053 RepID=UPI002723FA02|nr:response regulator [Phenylobacterium sp.]MDO8901468.1 response regulator [Phenylobacterium sp.]MDP2215222.1 response regulator [Phenylobacterium sp.]